MRRLTQQTIMAAPLYMRHATGRRLMLLGELLKGGASVQAKNDRNKTPVEMAREEDVEDSHKEIFELLLDGDEVQEAWQAQLVV